MRRTRRRRSAAAASASFVAIVVVLLLVAPLCRRASASASAFRTAAFSASFRRGGERRAVSRDGTGRRSSSTPPPLGLGKRRRRHFSFNLRSSSIATEEASSRPAPPAGGGGAADGKSASETSVISSQRGGRGRPSQPPLKANLHTTPLPELKSLMKSWDIPPYRATQIHRWIRDRGVTSFDEMIDLPKALREVLKERCSIGSLELAAEDVSKDGTRKRAYRLSDGQIVESVLMPYEDGRNTACVSSQAGCAMGCAFCATGQMGFARQLTSDEIFEQVALFSSHLKANDDRLSNVVLMGMGEPLANYNNVMEAIRRMNEELGIGARKITVSTVGIVPNIRKLAKEEMQVRLAVSLHCATDEERSKLLPANRRYGGLDELMSAVRDYVDTTKRRVTFEWALIENSNDDPHTARQLGKLLVRHGIRRDMAHVNLIPLNPTGGFGGSPSGRARAREFVRVLEEEFGVGATPRVRRGIDIDAGCGQLKAKVKKREDRESSERRRESGSEDKEEMEEERGMDLESFMEAESVRNSPPIVGVYEEEEEEEEGNADVPLEMESSATLRAFTDFVIESDSIDLDDESNVDFDDPTYVTEEEKAEAERLIRLVESSFPPPATKSDAKEEAVVETATTAVTTSIVDEESIRKAKKRRKKLLRNVRQIERLRVMAKEGRVLNEEQEAKVRREKEWREEIESLEHNLK